MKIWQTIINRTGVIPSSLKARLTAAVIVLVALSSVLVTAVALEIVYLDEQETTGEHQLRLLTSAAAHLESELANKRLLLQGITEEIPASGHASDAALQSLLSRHRSLRSSFSNVVIFDAKGWVRADLMKPANIGRGPYADRKYLIDTVRLKQGVISQPIVSALSGKPVVLITEPIFDRQGEVSHLITGAINLADPAFFGQTTRLGAGSTGYLFALTREGLMLHHPETARLVQNVNHEAGQVVRSTKAAMGGWEGWTLGENKRGVLAILTYKQMNSTRWILGSVYPAKEAFSGIAKARRYAWIAAAGIACLAGLIGWVMILWLLQPLRALRRHVHAVEHDEAGIAVLDLSRNDEVGALGRAFHSLSVKRELAERRLRSLSHTDTLTGLGNRRQFDQDIALAIDMATEARYGLALGFLDLDDFKKINDTLGHAAGDAVLQEFAKRLKNCLRPSDHPFRLAGDEFVIILERIDSAETVSRLADRLLQAVRLPFQFGDIEFAVTTSIGFVIARPPIAPLGDLLQHADAALYKAKRAGRNGYALKELHQSASVAGQ